MIAHLPRMSAATIGAGAVVARLDCLEPGGTRDLRVDHDVLAAGEMHDDIRSYADAVARC